MVSVFANKNNNGFMQVYHDGENCAKSNRYDSSPYKTYGEKLVFDNGFVHAASSIETLPAGTPMYLAGRIAYLKGLPAESKPASECYAGRWFSGWLEEKDRCHQHPPICQ
ncbi:hypothetical protein [Cellvibrio sp. QJXJ]|uniref:hypothetical protein n=1 Tax=Cellvibrio sp. QJXJ TaxID=2964606 RepID=UPI0021C2C51E|nr:hypothetical protein [Cellvibrio sp. QJXJ]UUA75220.1 hypothetical protein NNX04_22440 [Cellvibrio sp. QJXJ]